LKEGRKDGPVPYRLVLWKGGVEKGEGWKDVRKVIEGRMGEC
jgi:hypothetical protein